MEAPRLTTQSRDRIVQCLLRAANDISYREQLLNAPEAALQTSGLDPDEIRMVSTMRRVGLEEWGIDVRRFRSFLRDNGNKVSALPAR